MLIIQAQAMGMCFGVEEALEKAHSVSHPHQTTVLGEIVHNSQVQQELLQLGMHSQLESRREFLPETPSVLITAHGISQHYRQRLREKTIIDTTCPLVHRVHKAAAHWSKKGFRLILVGKPGHVEVLGITEDYPETLVVSHSDQVRADLGPNLAVLAQTTTPPDLYQEILEKIQSLHPNSEIRKVDTICRPTRERQEAIHHLLERVEALVVVGGAHSNNTLRLVEQAQKKNLPSIRVENPEELIPSWFQAFSVVGLSAGTSTPKIAIEQVHRRLLEISRAPKKQER